MLENNKGPSRKVNELDNRGSHFYLAMYWAQELASQTKNLELKEQFSAIAKELFKNEATIVNELNSTQGSSIDMKGYYKPMTEIVKNAMRPSNTFNSIINSI